jgi:hypothetical protein
MHVSIPATLKIFHFIINLTFMTTPLYLESIISNQAGTTTILALAVTSTLHRMGQIKFNLTKVCVITVKLRLV